MEFQEGMQQIGATYSASMESGDAESWIALWDEEGIQLPPNAPMRKGKAAILKSFRDDARDYIVRNFVIDAQSTSAFGSGEYGFACGTYSCEKMPRSGGPVRRIDAKVLSVLKRQRDGSWRIFRDCFNSNLPAG
jgi:ketosteroid isomerase-like protein